VNVRRALVDKRSKLAKYKAEGTRTVLLLDSDSIAVQGLAKGFASSHAEASSCGMDEVWVCYVPEGQHRTDAWFCPVKLDDRLYPELPEFGALWNRQFPIVYPGRY
jgi:hypothetical protein